MKNIEEAIKWTANNDKLTCMSSKGTDISNTVLLVAYLFNKSPEYIEVKVREYRRKIIKYNEDEKKRIPSIRRLKI